MTVWKDLQSKLAKLMPLGTPQIIFDIDDTLIDCRYRKHKVFLDFIQQDNVGMRFPKESVCLSALPIHQVCYKISDNLSNAEIENPDFERELLDFWRTNYFSYPYLLNDQAFPGAVDFVNKCLSLGSRIVYLTGRDIPGMERGTLERMSALGFPTTGPAVRFFLKPHPQQDDHAFKLTTFDTIHRDGPVLAALENELGNLNAMAERFQDALVYWRPTLFAPNPPQPHPRVKLLREFPED